MAQSFCFTVITEPQYGHFAVALIRTGAPQFGQFTVRISGFFSVLLPVSLARSH